MGVCACALSIMKENTDYKFICLFQFKSHQYNMIQNDNDDNNNDLNDYINDLDINVQTSPIAIFLFSL